MTLETYNHINQAIECLRNALASMPLLNHEQANLIEYYNDLQEYRNVYASDIIEIEKQFEAFFRR